MIKNKNIFLGKKILIYGLGKSGVSSYRFLNNKALVYLFDDNLKKKSRHQPKQWINNIEKISLFLMIILILKWPNLSLLK